MMKKHTLGMATLALSQALSAQAGNGERLDHFLSLSLDELVALPVTISTQTKQPVAKAPGVVTVITAEDIKATGATNLVDVLQGVPGLYVRASQFAFRPLVHFRGANANQTLLMVNGMPYKDLLWGFGIFWKGLPASMIERVEIIRGPGSALYGSDASGGVVNVITKTRDRITESEAGARAGSYASQAGWLQHGTDWNGFDIGLTAELSSTAGHAPFIAADAQTAADVRYGTDVSYAPADAHYGWRNEDLRFAIGQGNWRLRADYVRHHDLETGLTGAGVLDPVTHASDRRFNLSLLYDNAAFGPEWGVSAELRYQYLDYDSGDGFQERPPGYFDGTTTYPIGVVNQMQAAERRWDFEVSGLYTGLAGHAIRLGAGYSWQDLYSVEQTINAPTDPAALLNISDTPAAFAPETARRIGYAYLQDIWTLAEDWELTAGLRYDHYSDFGGTLNPRLALVWQTTDRLTSKLMYGQAFRAPSYLELYAPTSLALPNPDLDPETSRTWDLAFSYAAAKTLQFGLNLYHFQQDDLIAVVAGQYQNAGSQTVRGLELEAQWQAAPALRLAGSYAFLDPDDTPYRPLGVPEREAYLRADWSFRPGWNWNVQANWVGKRERRSGDLRAAVDAYALVDSTLRYAPSRDWEFAAAVRNLLDEDARDYTSSAIPGDLPLPGRSYYGELRYKF